MSKGITLIEIPFWWDGKVDSLLATIAHFRPDIKEVQIRLESFVNAKPISLEIPPSVVDRRKKLEIKRSKTYLVICSNYNRYPISSYSSLG